jgi:nitrate reductase NapE component
MQHQSDDEKRSDRKMWLWMAACCVPMIAVAVLFALGYWSSP